MSAGYAILFSVIICAIAAALEGACAGKNVKPFFATLKFPRYSAPLWVWSFIGGVYYLIFGFVTYRILRLDSSLLRNAILALVLFMMIANALSNYVIFRARDLWRSFLIGSVAPLFDATLFVSLIQLDAVAVWSLVPYLIYRVYGVWWGYALWKLNRPV
jgi:tryptophan-rich sensory protein